MANDPHRDMLPVKDVDDKSNKGTSGRGDLNLVSKLKRSDLEDKYIRLYDENTQIKKQLNSQEEKMKRLGTRLLRLIGEKKNSAHIYGKKSDGEGFEELQMRIIELEHENYTLKDKNIVLKQQLASHSRQHMAAHRSPNHSVHTTPRISQRQSSAPNVNDNNSVLSNRNQTSNIQLRQAEEHITGLNAEIKGLHNKIDALQQDLERSSLENQKTKVSENIELIRLQRSLKQQLIQITSLQVQVKNAEKNQKLLREELAKAHKENEEALQIISDKQKEILDLYTKLEEKNICRLEQEEMKERIKDLMMERDTLKERSDFLMKSIESAASEAEIVKDLKKSLASEKIKKKELKLSLENTQKLLQSLQESVRLSHTSASDEILSKSSSSESRIVKSKDLKHSSVETQTQTMYDPLRSVLLNTSGGSELQLLASTQLKHSHRIEYMPNLTVQECQNSLSTKVNGRKPSFKSIGVLVNLPSNSECPEGNSRTTINTEVSGDFQTSESKRISECNSNIQKTLEAEKINLTRELEYVKKMLRGQTQRCETQQQEINRLKFELKVNDKKYNDILHRLELYLTNNNLNNRILEIQEPKCLNTKEDETVIKKTTETSPGNVNLMSPQTDWFERGKISDNGEKRRFIDLKFLDSSDDGDDNEDAKDGRKQKKSNAKIENLSEKISETKEEQSISERSLCSPKPSENAGELPSRKNLKELKIKLDEINAVSSESIDEIDNYISRMKNTEDELLSTKFLIERLKNKKTRSADQEDSQSNMVASPIKAMETVIICIEWLKLEPGTSVWLNNNVNFLFIDFSFLDLRGEETETPSSLKKPNKPVEKCHFNFIKSIEITDNRKTALQSIRNHPEKELIVFKVVSEPEDSGDEGECVDIGVAIVTVVQFFESSPKASLFLPVKNVVDPNEVLGTLSVRLSSSVIF